MNKFLFTGNLGKDAELKATSGGTSVLSFSVAVKSGYGDNAKTNWIHCAMFGKRAEGRVIDFLKKGAQVAISGEFELKEWDSQDGTKNKMPSVRVDELDLIGGKPEQQGYQPPQPQGGFQQPQQVPQQTPQQGGFTQPAQYQGGQTGGFPDGDSDIPFAKFDII